MKFSRLAATGAAIALIGGSIAFVGTSATADSTTYYTASDFGVESSPYPAGWFVGDGSTGTLSSETAGLVAPGTMQILNGTTPITGIANLIAGASFNVASGNAFFQVSLFNTPDGEGQGFTTLRPVNPNVLTGQWTLSQSLPGLTAGTAYDLSTIVAGLSEGYQILAYGAFVDPGTTATIASITWGGATSVFTSKPATVTPTTPAAPATPVKTSASFTG